MVPNIAFFRDSGQNAQLVASTLSDTEQDALIGFIQQSEGTEELQHYASSEAAHIGYFLSLNETAEPRINVSCSAPWMLRWHLIGNYPRSFC